jgi:hypothetical protein
MYSPFDFTVYLSALCGLIMVTGAIWLLRTGVVKLSEAGRHPNGLSVEVANKIKLSSGYPAVGLFIIGFVFIGYAMYMSKPLPTALPISIEGQLNIDSTDTVTMTIEPDNVIASIHPDSNGHLDQKFDVEFHRVKVRINAAGYNPQSKYFTLDLDHASNGKIELPPDLDFKKVDDKGKPAAGSIAAIPASINVPLNGVSTF